MLATDGLRELSRFASLPHVGAWVAGAAPPCACLPQEVTGVTWKASESIFWKVADFPGLWRAAVLGFEGWSYVADFRTLRRVLALPDSPLAGECAAIIMAHRPDARCASSVCRSLPSHVMADPVRAFYAPLAKPICAFLPAIEQGCAGQTG